MSLLIKALDHLEKNKQAEKDKKQTGEYVPDESLLLELVPVEPKKTEINSDTEDVSAVADRESSAEAKSNRLALERELSLEEEAGLTDASFVANKYAKPKSASKSLNKPTQEPKPSKNSIPESLPSSSANSKADISTQAATSQTVNDELNQKAAAKVFVANKQVKAPSSKLALISLGVVGALLVWLGLQGYHYINKLTTPEAVVLKPSEPIRPQVAVAEPVDVQPASIAPSVEVAMSAQENQPENEVSAIEDLDGNTGTAAFKDKKAVEKSNVVEDVIEGEPKKAAAKKSNKDSNAYIAENETDAGAYYSESGHNKKQKSVTLISKAQPQGVDPILLSAYQAFVRGEDASAQQQYRQVLQQDVRNVDALLGMAAIAQRQGRDADAQGWYQKVLEIEPRNSIAQTASVSPQSNAGEVNAESRIKNMIAQQPDGANLHAALGNLYAEQNQWPSAQEAYFNASRLAPNNADYAFNLAISLDQMGKSGLALSQYERALALLNKSGGTSPDRVQLEARIRELQ